MKIKLTSIFVDDTDKAVKFYTEVLGFIKKVYVPLAKLVIIASPEEPDGTSLLLEPNDNDIAKTFQDALYKIGLPVIVLGVEDMQKEYERLVRLGVVFTGEPVKTEAGFEAVFDDTCGNYIQIFQFFDEKNLTISPEN